MTCALRHAIAEISDLASHLEPDHRVVSAWMAEVPITALGGRTALELARDGEGSLVNDLLRLWIFLDG